MRAVIVSVRYADFLAQSLPVWRAFLPPGTITVATAPGDRETLTLARRNKVPAFQTNAWTQRDATCHVTRERPQFNMALGLDYAFGFVGTRPPPAVGELCVSLDADVVPFGTWPVDESFESDVLYGLPRYKCENHGQLMAHRSGLTSIHAYRFMKNKRPAGYAQIFRYRPGLRFGSYPSAGQYDFDFGELFARRNMRRDVYVLHLGRRGGHDNWRQRTVPPWRTRPLVAKTVTAVAS